MLIIAWFALVPVELSDYFGIPIVCSLFFLGYDLLFHSSEYNTSKSVRHPNAKK